MNYNITAPERLILESLFKREKTFPELIECSSLDHEVLQFVISSLISKNLVLIHNHTYGINKNLADTMKSELKNPVDTFTEVNELLSNCITLTKFGNAKFKLKKISVTKEEEVILKGLLDQIDFFIKSLNKNEDKPLSEQKIIFWGEGNYGQIINSCIHL